MSVKPIVLRAMAERDIDEALTYYLREAGSAVALNFIEALENALQTIGDHSAAGSPCIAHELGLPGVRSQPLARFPHLAFYVERSDHIDIWRVLDGRRDIPASLNDSSQAES